MGNNKRGKMLPEFKVKNVFFFHAAAPFLKQQLKLNIRVCVTIVIVCAHKQSSKQQNFKQTNKTNKKVILAIRKRKRAKINAHNHRQTHIHTNHQDQSHVRSGIIDKCACVLFLCVTKQTENLLIEPSCSSNNNNRKGRWTELLTREKT